MTVREEAKWCIQQDGMLAEIRKKIRSGKADYEDTAAYSARAGKMIGALFSRRLPEIPPEEREQLCVELLHDQYIDINAAVDAAQRYLDERLGIQLAPQHAPFDSERGHQIGSSLRDLSKPVETLQRRAKAATETTVKSMHDDRMKTEAKFRSRAGLNCFITRKAVSGCCAWCTAMAGRFEYGEEPDDIYRRHDNCDCTVTFENGRKRQDVWSKREWEAPEPGAGAGDPVVLTEEQADQLNLLGKLKSLFSGQPYQARITEFAEQLPNIQNRNVAKLLRNALENTEFAQSPDRRSVYRDGKVFLSKTATHSTIAHELFHRIDAWNEVTKRGMLDDCLITDYERLKNISESTGQTLGDMLYLKYQDAFSRPGKLKPDYRGVSDIIEGMTDGGTKLGYGHIASNPEYWKKPGALSHEVFAQYGRMYFEENPAVFDMLKEIFPDTTAQIDAIIPAIAQFGR